MHNNLMMVTKMQQQRKEMESENAQLKQDLGRMQQMHCNETHDKQKYMEGAVWMGKRMSGEVERVCKVFETLMQDY